MRRSRLGETELAGVNLFAAGDDPGDRAETHAHPRRAGIDEFPAARRQNIAGSSS